MKRILVTGAGGFIGSHLVERLLSSGHAVRAFVRYNSSNNWGWIEGVSRHKNLEVVAGDIRDYDSVFAAMKGCHSVFHLAALIGIPYSYVSPQAYIKTNVDGTYNVLQAAKELGAQNVIITSTSETYGTAKYVPIDEDHPSVGQSPYAASKIAADHFAISYHRSFGLPVKIVRPFNTYGPRQSARAIIPTIISQILAGKRSICLGNIHPTRDLTFVKDTADAFIAIAESKGLAGQATNVGMCSEISVKDLALRIASRMKARIKIVEDVARVRKKGSEVERLFCQNSKLIENTAWRPKYTLDKGLEETITWMRQHQDRYKAHLYNI